MKSLPNKNPNLDHLKKEAKKLRSLHRNHDSHSCSRIRHYDSSYTNHTNDEIFKSKFSILDAQRIVAREYGFSSWAKLKRFIESTGKHFNQKLHDELILLQQQDIDMRNQLIADGVLYDGYHPKMEQVQNENAEKLKDIIEKFGWPGTSLVGLDGCRAAWRIAQHAISQPDFQKFCLPLLTQAVESDEAPVRQLAFLTDSILFHSMKPQLYGSIADWDENGNLTFGDVEDIKLLDQRRGLVGLGPSKQDIAAHQQEVINEGAIPPTDLAKYKKDEMNWAKKVGWI